jgi:hypothetical protein
MRGEERDGIRQALPFRTRDKLPRNPQVAFRKGQAGEVVSDKKDAAFRKRDYLALKTRIEMRLKWALLHHALPVD